MDKSIEDHIVSRMNSIQKLLKPLGLKLKGYEPGISAYQEIPDNPYRTLHFNQYEWEWLEPKLRELLRLRKQCRK